MIDSEKDTLRALSAAREVVDGRDFEADMPAILVTLDHVVATVLIAVMGNDARKAAEMLNEGLLPAVEERIAQYEARHRGQG
jgi:hypothetical protein